MVSIVLEWSCPCGTTATGVLVKRVRVNKKSMRTLGQGLGLMPRTCTACRKPLPDSLPAKARLADDSFAAVNAYRERKGWPLLTTAQVSEA
jgi:hypothetical protein